MPGSFATAGPPLVFDATMGEPTPPGGTRPGAPVEPSVASRQAAEPERPDWRRRAAQCVVAVVVAVPVVRMFELVRGVSAMPYSDYWIIFGGLVRADGSVDLGDLLVRHNDHPLLVAKSLYALNLQLFDGSNATLALAVLLVGILQLVAVGVLLARSRLSFAERSLVLILSSVLLFSMNGAWNYVLAMSGAAWLTANVLVLAAIVLRQHDRTWGAFALGVLATAV